MTEADKPNEGELILYQTQEGAVRIEVLYESETFWLNQKKIAELFGVDLRTMSYHLNQIYDSAELSREATLRKTWRVQQEGNREVRREIEFYNLDAIISVGYRVNSTQATRFRIWATQTLREFVIKGFVLDDERLKLPALRMVEQEGFERKEAIPREAVYTYVEAKLKMNPHTGHKSSMVCRASGKHLRGNSMPPERPGEPGRRFNHVRFHRRICFHARNQSASLPRPYRKDCARLRRRRDDSHQPSLGPGDSSQ